jgi:cytochrome c biogenesis protein CcmG/thiol:disulfide interchange protein DsbE
MRPKSLLCGCFFAFATVLGAMEVQAAIVVGQAAPPLIAQELNTAGFDLERLRGKVIMVNFWATWCPPCREEMPLLDRVYQNYHGQGLEIIGISVDRARSRDEVATMAAQMSYPIAAITDVTVNGFGRPSVLPITYLVDREGIVSAILTPALGPLSEQALVTAVRPLLVTRTVR